MVLIQPESIVLARVVPPLQPHDELDALGRPRGRDAKQFADVDDAESAQLHVMPRQVRARADHFVAAALHFHRVIGDEAVFQRAVEEAGLKDHILSLGTVPFEQVPQYIAVSKVGLILFQPVSLGYILGMPHKMFDYMRESVPYIAPTFVHEIKHKHSIQGRDH